MIGYLLQKLLISALIISGTCGFSGVMMAIYSSVNAVFGTSISSSFLSLKRARTIAESIVSGGVLGVISIAVLPTLPYGLLFGGGGFMLGMLGVPRKILRRMRRISHWFTHKSPAQKKSGVILGGIGGLCSLLIIRQIVDVGLYEGIWSAVLGGGVSGFIGVLWGEGFAGRDMRLWGVLGGLSVFFGIMLGGPLVELLGVQVLAIGSFLSVMIGGLLPLLLFGLFPFARFLSRGFIPLFSLFRFRKILCTQCFHMTSPFKSQYVAGIRSCEHCGQTVERTDVSGKVLFSFGVFPFHYRGHCYDLTNPEFTLVPLPQRQFLFSNPGFQSAEHHVAVSDVYIDTETCDCRRLEQFLTYVLHYMPPRSVRSIRVFYRGNLDNLGERLKNALQNTFHQIHSFS
jgi:hypothetical protein